MKNGAVPYFRPTLLSSDDSDGCSEPLAQLINKCWAEDPLERPDFHTLKARIRKLNRFVGQLRAAVGPFTIMAKRCLGLSCGLSAFANYTLVAFAIRKPPGSQRHRYQVVFNSRNGCLVFRESKITFEGVAGTETAVIFSTTCCRGWSSTRTTWSRWWKRGRPTSSSRRNEPKISST